MQRNRVRLASSGRELIAKRKSETHPSGMVAVGGVNYDSVQSSSDDGQCMVGGGKNGTASESVTPPNNGVDVLQSKIGRFKPLTGSLSEARDVSEIYAIYRAERATVLCGSSVQQSSFEFKVPPQVLHLATHGFVLDDTNRFDQALLLSGIALSGANLVKKTAEPISGPLGILRAIDVTGLNLEGTELVVLSACDSGRGAFDWGGRIYSLGHAFQLAGAHYVVVTLWPVGDRSGKDFMAAFYKNWLSTSGLDPRAALSRTKEEMSAEGYDPGVSAAYAVLGW